MIIYFLLVVEILILNMQRKSGRISDAKFCKIICVSFILLTALRHNNVGSDTTVYYLSFNNIVNRYITFNDLLAESFFDKGFYIVFWLVARVFGNFIFMTILVACVFYIPISVLIYRYSDDCGLSYLSLMAFNFFQFSMTGMRQTMALGFIICLVLELKKDHSDYRKCLLFYFLATVMHRSALIAGVYFLFRVLKNKKMLIRLSLVIIPICYVFRGQIVRMLAGLYEDIGYSKGFEFSNGNAGLTTFLVYCMLVIVGLLCYSRYIDNEPSANIDYMAMVLGTIFLGFVSVVSVMFRVGWYFSIIIVLFLPSIIRHSFKNNGQISIANLGVYGGILYMYFFITIGSATVVPYRFFFQ